VARTLPAAASGRDDELAGEALLAERFVAPDFEHELELRRAHHAEVFRTLARDVEGRMSVEQVADDLSLLADSVLRVTAKWCWERLKTRHREVPQFAIIGYGKLGGKELGYGSDLDIVFVFDDDDERAPEIYSAYVRKLINWLTVKTGEGDLFEIDTALRPNGNSGLLVTSFTAYADYQQQRGSNTAWTWEHQAMTRAASCSAARTCARASTPCARPSSPRHATLRCCAPRSPPCASACAPPIRCAARAST